MRLYVNRNEVPFLKHALQKVIATTDSQIESDRLSDLLERVELCEELQNNIRQANKN